MEKAKARAAAADERLRKQEASAAAGEEGEETATDTSGLLQSVRALLQKMENGKFAAKAEMPEDLLAAMTAVQQQVMAACPPPEPALDGPLEPDRASAASRTRKAGAALEDDGQDELASDGDEDLTSEDEVMDELDGIDEKGESASLAVARRLKRLRRT